MIVRFSSLDHQRTGVGDNLVEKRGEAFQFG